MQTTARSENAAVYTVGVHKMDEDTLIQTALGILSRRMTKPGSVITSPSDVRNLCRLQFGSLEHEEFGIVWLNTQHGVITTESMFRGTLSQTSVYPREVVKRALQLNAGAAILVHNHPSGAVEPSRADEHLTGVLKSALKLVDVAVLDHIIVSAHDSMSFAERGLI